MPQRTDGLTPHQLLELMLACDDRDEIHAIATGWLRAYPPSSAPLEASGTEGRENLGTLMQSTGCEAGLTDAEADAMSDRNSVFLLAARPRTAPGSLDPIAIYSRREAADAWVAIQEPVLQEVLEVHRYRLDEHTGDDYWAKPAVNSGAAAFALLAGMPDDSDPR